MALIHVNFFSQTLGMNRSMDVILPQIKNGAGQKEVFCFQENDIPVLYLLHGGSDDHTMWQRQTSIERYAVAKGLAVIMPSTDLGSYTDMKYGHDFYQFFSEELPEIVQEFFPCLTVSREKTFIAGQSMGGYGTLKLGLTQPERFSYVAALSAMINVRKMFEGEAVSAFAENVFGSKEELINSVNDLYYDTDALLKRGGELPHFMLVCGTEDFMYPENLEYYSKYGQELHIEKVFAPGEHEWGFWDRYIRQVLDWLPLGDEKEGR